MQQVQNQGSMNVVLEYPHNDKFDYETRLVRLNLDEERIADIKSGKGFIISAPKGIKKDIKHQDGIFSSRYGSNSISDVDSFTAGYRCKCGMKRGSVFHGEICDVCGEKVLYVGDDISIVGYLKLKDKYWIIHPNIYCTLAAFIGGPKLNRIIEPDIQVDSDGKIIPNIPTKKDEPFRGIGLPMFKERFDEIMDFYLTKYPAKKIYYDDIMSQKDKVFTHSIAVYSSLLRPSKLDNGSLRYEACNEQFNMLATLVYKCNKDRLKMDQKIKEKYQLLYDIQFQLNSVYGELKEILAKKKGDIRSAIGGRYSFTERSVIKQDVNLKADQIRLPFHGLCELLQQVIINILVRTYHFSYAEAYKKWYKAQINTESVDKIIYDIIDGLIKDSDEGLDLIINRNPKLN